VAPVANTACHLVCGPEPMMDAVETALVARGVPPARVFSEHFKYDFSGRSPLARRMRRAWWGLSVASLLALVLALAWR
jgi:ferredoxin-NADP reductase